MKCGWYTEVTGSSQIILKSSILGDRKLTNHTEEFYLLQYTENCVIHSEVNQHFRKHVTSIFRVKEYAEKETRVKMGAVISQKTKLFRPISEITSNPTEIIFLG
jgi:hypothetical protein